jgi:hypothetical protein
MENKMKIYKIAFAGLVLSLALLTGIIFQQTTSANESNLECSDLTGCIAGASCGGPGTTNGCDITCQQGSLVRCGYKPPNND